PAMPRPRNIGTSVFGKPLPLLNICLLHGCRSGGAGATCWALPARRVVLLVLRADLDERGNIATAALCHVGAAAVADLDAGCDVAVAVLGQDRRVIRAELADAGAVAATVLIEIGAIPVALLADRRKVAPARLARDRSVVVAVLLDPDPVPETGLRTAPGIRVAVLL